VSEPVPSERAWWRTISVGRICVAASAVALGIGIYQLTRPHVLTGELGYNLGYDDGVYVGAALRFLAGQAPYRDFTFVHPPGIVYVLSPIGLLGRAFGERDALVFARCLTVLVTAANPALAGYLVRSLGRTAVGVAAFALALWPLTVGVDRTVELEPYLVLFCLVGAGVLYDAAGRVGTGRRVVLAGFWFGVAASVKVWAVLVIVAAVVCLARTPRRAVAVLGGALAAGVLIDLPFLALAPSRFVHDVIVDQLKRNDLTTMTPFGERLRLLTGVAGLPAVDHSVVLAIIVAVALALAVVAAHTLRADRSRPVEWFVLAASVAVVAGMFVSGGFYDHYAYFPAAFLAPLIGGTVGCLLRLRPIRAGARARAAVAAAAAVLAIAVGAQQLQHATDYLGEASDPGARLAQLVPAGTCAFSDFPTDLILAGRYIDDDANCPRVADPFGLYLADDGGTPPHLPPPAHRAAFLDQWADRLMRYDVVVLRIPFSDFVPWTPQLMTWFDHNYRLVAHLDETYAQPYIDVAKDEYVYQRIGSAQ
jgi:hypothetical protein